MKTTDFDPSSALHRMIMRDRIAAGWVPTTGPRWRVISLGKGRASLIGSATCATCATALEAVAQAVGNGFHPIGPTVAVLDHVITEEDVSNWLATRDAWIASQGSP